MKPPAPVTRTVPPEACSWRSGAERRRPRRDDMRRGGRRCSGRAPRCGDQPVRSRSRVGSPTMNGGSTPRGQRRIAARWRATRCSVLHKLGHAAHRDGNAGADVDDRLRPGCGRGRGTRRRRPARRGSPARPRGCLSGTSRPAPFGLGRLARPLRRRRVCPLARADVVETAGEDHANPPLSGSGDGLLEHALGRAVADDGTVGSSSVRSRRGSPCRMRRRAGEEYRGRRALPPDGAEDCARHGQVVSEGLPRVVTTAGAAAR